MLTCQMRKCVGQLISAKRLVLHSSKTNMADEEEHLWQISSFVFSFIFKGLVAVAVLFTATILTKFFSYERDSHISNLVDTNFCRSSECLRCSHKLTKSPLETAELLLTKLDEFARVKSDKGELDRLYKAIEYNRTQKKRNNFSSAQKPTVFYLYGLSGRPWHDCLSDQLTTLVCSENFEMIRSEFNQIRFNASDEGWVKNSTPEGDWLVYHLINQGERVVNNCRKCPLSVEIIESVELIIKGCSFGNALFSVVRAGTHITAHYGPTNCRIRCHLPLYVPNNCRLCVNGQERMWNERELMLFDDSFLHEAWHKGVDSERVVLMVDLWHPEITAVEKEALAFMFPPRSHVADIP